MPEGKTTGGHSCLAHISATAAAKSLQSCPTLCDPIDGSPSGSTIPGILQARTLEWVAIPFPMHECEKWKGSRSVMSDSATPWTAAHQAPLSMGFSRQERWSGVPLPIHLVYCKVAKGHEKGWQLNLRIKRSHKDFKLNILTFKLIG